MTFDFMAREAWAPLRGFEAFWVSNFGNVRRWTSTGYSKWIVGHNDAHGYRLVWISNAEGVRRREFVHRLVLLAFVGEPEPGRDWALHWDDDPVNNRLDNLRWGTALENAADRRRNRERVETSRVERIAEDAARGVYRFANWAAS